MTLLINPEDSGKDGLIAEITSTAGVALPEFYNADGPIPLHIRCLAAADGVIPWTEDYETGDSYLVSVGNVDDKPNGGTFTVTFNATASAAQSFDATAATLTTAFSTASTTATYGNVTVTLMEQGVYSLDWDAVGAVPEVTVQTTYLRPQCEASVEVFRAGSGSEKARQVITIRRTAVASATVSTAYTPTTVTAIESIVATSTSNTAYIVDFGDAYSGFAIFEISAGGKSAYINIGPQMTLEEIGIALSSHPNISYQTDGEADNIAVTSVDGNVGIEFTGTLSGATLAKTITAASVESGAVTIITTSAAHGYAVGDAVFISGSNSTPTIDGQRVVTAVGSSTTFTIAVDVTVAGTAGTVIGYNYIGIINDDDITSAKGNTGTISFATQALADEFYNTTADELSFVLHVKRLRGAASNTILSTPITLNRELINGATLSAPSGTVSAFVKKTELGTNVMTALGVAVGSSGAVVVNGGALGTPSSGNVGACTLDGTNLAGFRGVPQNAQTGNYTLVIADAGKHIYHAAAAGAGDTYTIPANSSVAFVIGTAVTFVNRDTTNAVSIAITTDTLTLAGTGTTGTRTLAAYGIATAVKITSTEWMISGTGLT